MKQKKVQSLSRKLFVNFILSCLLPIVAVSFFSGLFVWKVSVSGDTQPVQKNNTKLISAYMTNILTI